MKRITKLVVLLVLAAILCPVLAGCSSGKVQPTIVYDKKYEYGTTTETYHRYLVFHADHTGYYETLVTYTDGKVSSARTDFFWRVSDDGMVYLFGSKTTYHDDDTEKQSLSNLLNFTFGMPITFGDGFLVTLNTSSAGYVYRYVLEGSDLAKDLEKGIDAED